MIAIITIIMMISIKIFKLFYEQKKKGAAPLLDVSYFFRFSIFYQVCASGMICGMYKISIPYHILLYHIYELVMLVDVELVKLVT